MNVFTFIVFCTEILVSKQCRPCSQFSAVCEKGEYVSSEMLCSACPVDTFQPVYMPYSYTECQDCQQSYGTTDPGATSEDACQCKIIVSNVVEPR